MQLKQKGWQCNQDRVTLPTMFFLKNILHIPPALPFYIDQP